MPDYNIQSSQAINRNEMDQNNQSDILKPSYSIQDQNYTERMQRQVNVKGSQIYIRAQQYDKSQGNDYNKGSNRSKKTVIKQKSKKKFFEKKQTKSQNIKSPSKSSNKNHHGKSQEYQQKSEKSSKMSKSAYTTTQQIMTKYEITEIMKRRHEKEGNQHKNCKTFGKVLLVVLLFPFSLIYLLIVHIKNKKSVKQPRLQPRQDQQLQKMSKKSSSKKSSRKKQIKQPNCLQRCCYSCFCYYLCCSCCQDCTCGTRCCNKLQKCAECMCQNSLMQCIDNFFHKCFVKNCQKCCRYVCCINNDHEKLDTLDRLQALNLKSYKKRQMERQRQSQKYTLRSSQSL